MQCVRLPELNTRAFKNPRLRTVHVAEVVELHLAGAMQQQMYYAHNR
jgi:hypothetical protein